jgi:predicted nucleic acid-binding protein
MIVVDTSAWIDYFRGIIVPHTEILDAELQKNMIITGDLIIVELLQGFKTKRAYERAKKLIERLEYRDLAGRAIALKSAENFRLLRSKGVTVRKTIEVIIATFCVENGFQIIHNDRDFDPMEKYLGLSVIK